MPDGVGKATTEGYIARSGDHITDLEKARKVPVVDIVDALSTVFDPEIPVNIYELGLIYDIEAKDNGDVYITMSLTAPGCPVAGILPKQAADAVAKLAHVGLVEVELIWDPAWTKDRMSDDAKLALDIL
jgi:FeS assembly SUF system protein